MKVLSPYGKVFYGQHGDTTPAFGKGQGSPNLAANRENQKMKAIVGNLNQSGKGQQSTIENADKEGENSSPETSLMPTSMLVDEKGIQNRGSSCLDNEYQ